MLDASGEDMQRTSNYFVNVPYQDPQTRNNRLRTVNQTIMLIVPTLCQDLP